MYTGTLRFSLPTGLTHLKILAVFNANIEKTKDKQFDYPAPSNVGAGRSHRWIVRGAQKLTSSRSVEPQTKQHSHLAHSHRRVPSTAIGGPRHNRPYQNMGQCAIFLTNLSMVNVDFRFYDLTFCFSNMMKGHDANIVHRTFLLSSHVMHTYIRCS